MPIAFKAALLALAAIPLVSMSPATQSGVAPWMHPEIVRVDCTFVTGSAFRVGRNLFLSVAHVTKNAGCKINGQAFKVLRSTGDFSILQSDIADDRWLKIDCGGFVKGRKYQAIGFAHGLETQTEVDLEATGQRTRDGQAVLEGVFTVIPGQSGGAVIDAESGSVVGTINTYESETGTSGSVELRGTEMCRHA